MTIAAIVKTEDDPKKVVVFRTEPPLTPEVFDEFKPHAGKHLDDDLHFGFRLGFLTVNRVHNIVAHIPGIEQCLTYAENSLANKKGKAETAREKAFRDLANQLSLPIKDAPVPKALEVAGKPNTRRPPRVPRRRQVVNFAKKVVGREEIGVILGLERAFVAAWASAEADRAFNKTTARRLRCSDVCRPFRTERYSHQQNARVPHQ